MLLTFFSHIVMCAVYYIWIRMHPIILCVGEGDRDARHKEHVLKGISEAACCHTHMVLGYNLSLLWTH